MKIIFAGTPEFAATALTELIKKGHEVSLVLTQPDRPSGRGRKLKASEVKQVALQNGIPVKTPLTLKREKGLPETAEAIDAMKAEQADLLVVAAYGLILPQEVLDVAKGVAIAGGKRIKALNIHASLLPKWRGAAPITRSIEAGDAETGVTLMEMELGLDTGDMIYKEAVKIGDGDTSETLTNKLSQLGASMLIRFLESPESFTAQKQPEGATYASKLQKAEAPIDWKEPAEKIARKIMAFNPFPGATALLNGETIKLWKAKKTDERTNAEAGTVLSAGASGVNVACGDGCVLTLTELQRPGGKRLSAQNFLQGHKIEKGELLQ